MLSSSETEEPMATKTKGRGAALPQLARLQTQGERLYRRVRKDAEALLARGRKQLSQDVRILQVRAERAARDLEASLLRRVHAASEGQVKKLERRVTALEQRLAALERATASPERGAA
jgi:hypothetical protein